MIDAGLRRRMEVAARGILRPVVPGLCRAGMTADAIPFLAAESVCAAASDVVALASRDAAAVGDPCYVFDSYSSFRAVLAYRVASLLHELSLSAADASMRRRMQCAARRISERAKVATGVEIHPAAKIGERFVVDHGNGTVIGEQVEIGDDCYILQNVILGGRSIGRSANGQEARRHPRIGNRVEIGAGVMVLGPVTVGDDSCLEPGSRITTDIPSGSRVRIISTIQVTVGNGFPEINGVAATGDGLILCGRRLDGCLPVLLDKSQDLMGFLEVHHRSDIHIHCGMPVEFNLRDVLIGLIADGILVSYISPACVFRSKLDER